MAWTFQFWLEEVYSYHFVSLKFYAKIIKDMFSIFSYFSE